MAAAGGTAERSAIAAGEVFRTPVGVRLVEGVWRAVPVVSILLACTVAAYVLGPEPYRSFAPILGVLTGGALVVGLATYLGRHRKLVVDPERGRFWEFPSRSPLHGTASDVADVSVARRGLIWRIEVRRFDGTVDRFGVPAALHPRSANLLSAADSLRSLTG